VSASPSPDVRVIHGRGPRVVVSRQEGSFPTRSRGLRSDREGKGEKRRNPRCTLWPQTVAQFAASSAIEGGSQGGTRYIRPAKQKRSGGSSSSRRELAEGAASCGLRLPVREEGSSHVEDGKTTTSKYDVHSKLESTVDLE
jgi:hypothetical protein